MSTQIENIAIKLVGGLSILLQTITLACLGYIISQLDNHRNMISALESRIVAVETTQHDHEARLQSFNEQSLYKHEKDMKP